MPIEVELKLTIPHSEVAAFKQLTYLRDHATSGPSVQHVRNTYYDTPRLDLFKLGVGLRVREIDGHFFQTVKYAGQSQAGLHQRQELEQALPKPEFDFSLLPDDDVLKQALLTHSWEPELQALFRTDFQRTLWLLRYADGSEIEMVLDQGAIIVANQREEICEVELELQSGNEAALHAVAAELVRTITLTPEDKSKAARGYALYSRIVNRS